MHERLLVHEGEHVQVCKVFFCLCAYVTVCAAKFLAHVLDMEREHRRRKRSVEVKRGRGKKSAFIRSN